MPQTLTVGQRVDENGNPLPAGGLTVGQRVDENGNPISEAPSQTYGTGVVGQTKDFISNAWQTGPVAQVAAMPGQVAHPIETAKGMGQANQELFDQAYNAFKKGDYSHAAVKGLFYLLNGIPGLGSTMSQAGEELSQGHYGAGFGKAFGMGTTLSAPSLVAPTLPEVAAKLNAVEAARKATAKVKPEANAAYFKNLDKAIGPTAKSPAQDVINKTGARKYLVAEHTAVPIENMQQFVDAADRSIAVGQAAFDSHVDAYANESIPTKPMDAAKTALSEMKGARASDLAAGLKAVKDFGLDKQPTMRRAADVLYRLNAETKAIRAKNKYDVATIRATDPVYVAMEAMSDSLRDGIFGFLEDKGIPGVRQWRREQGNLIAVRNAAQKVVFKGDQPMTGAAGQNLPSRFVAKAVRYGTATAGAGAGYALGGGPFTGALGAAGGVVLGEQLANKFVPRLTRNDLLKSAFKGLTGEAPTFPEAPPAQPVPSHPVTVGATMPPRSAPAMAVPQTASAQRPLPVQEPAALPLPGEPPQAPPLRAGVPAPAQTGTVGTPVPPRGPVVRGGQAEPRLPAPRRMAAGRSGGARAPQSGVAALPESTREDFHSLVPFARKHGFSGSVDELADHYRAKLDEARVIQRETDLPSEDVDTGRELLREISDFGGFGINEEAGLSGKAGMKGELEHMLENLHKRKKARGIIKRGKRAGQEVKLPPRMGGGLPGLPNIVVRKGGYPADTVFERIRQDPRWANKWDNLSDFLAAVDKAIYQEVSGMVPEGTHTLSLDSIMRGALGVHPDRAWWEPQPPPDFPFGEGEPPTPTKPKKGSS